MPWITVTPSGGPTSHFFGSDRFEVLAHTCASCRRPELTRAASGSAGKDRIRDGQDRNCRCTASCTHTPADAAARADGNSELVGQQSYGARSDVAEQPIARPDRK